VALWIAPNVEHYEYLPPGPHTPWPARAPAPDVQQYSLRDYGNRVGFWRMLEVLDRYGIRCSTTLNLSVLSQFPEVRDAMLARDWVFVNHGFYNTRPITEFDDDEERAFYAAIRSEFRRLTGGKEEIVGQSGPGGPATPSERRTSSPKPASVTRRTGSSTTTPYRSTSETDVSSASPTPVS